MNILVKFIKKKLFLCEYFERKFKKQNFYCLEQVVKLTIFEKIQPNIYEISYSIFEKKYNLIYNILYQYVL